MYFTYGFFSIAYFPVGYFPEVPQTVRDIVWKPLSITLGYVLALSSGFVVAIKESPYKLELSDTGYTAGLSKTFNMEMQNENL